MSNSIFVSKHQCILGELVVATTNEGVCLLEFGDRSTLEKQIKNLSKELNLPLVEADNKYSIQLKEELDLYFGKNLKKFTIPIVFTGTDFQKRVYQSLIKIPYGTISTYKQQAIVLGDVKAIRAVATANGSNKIAIVVPCHRIIGSNGSMVGYAGGIHRKEVLLQLENALQQTQLTLL